jgi:hypothetical protein
VTRRTPFWASALPLLGVVACADVWNFSDLEEGGPPDASTGGDVVERAESGADATPDGAEEAGDSSRELPDAREEGEAGEAGLSPREGGVGDGGDDGASAAACKLHCAMGCCDSDGSCRTGNATAYCGTNGDACQACPSCGTGPCCTSNKACGCLLALICN